MRTRTLLALLVALPVSFAATACVKEAENALAPASSVAAPSTVVPNTGEECFDATADIMVDTHDEGNRRAEPAGIDVVAASALVNGDVLDVKFTTVGPIDSALNPEFNVFQGNLDVARDRTFELRASKLQGGWVARLVTFPPNGVEKRTTLAVPVSVKGNELSFSVKKDDIPSIATIQWLFGASSGASDENRVFDDCLPFAQTGTRGTGVPGTSAPQGTSPGPAPGATGKVGSTLRAPDGSRVTVKTVEVPAIPNNGFTDLPVAGEQWAAVEVEVCAGSRVLEHLSENRMTIVMSDGRRIAAHDGANIPKEPRLPIDESLRPNSCKAGWAAFLVSAKATATGVAYDAGGAGVGPLLTFEV